MDTRTGPVTIETVMEEERAALRPRAEPQPLRALCISGGGIRSATFAWGALQAMAQHGLLPQFDYLSTVSGGGYIGSWLTAWIQRAGGLERMQDQLKPNAAIPAGAPNPIEHLRAYNNYLTPRLGLQSADTWTLASTMLRNVFLNWLVFIPLLLVGLMAPRLMAEIFGVPDLLSNGANDAMVVAALVGLFVCYWNILRYLPGVGGVNHTARDFLLKALGPLLLAAMLATVADSYLDLGPTVALSGAFAVLAWLAYTAFAGREARRGQRGRRLMALLGGVTLFGLTEGCGMWLVQTSSLLPSWPHALLPSWRAQVVFGPPLFVALFGVAGAIFTGLSSHVLDSEDREWMARAGAYMMMFNAVWVIAFATVLYAPDWFVAAPWKQWLLALAGIASGWITSSAGFSAGPAVANGGSEGSAGAASGVQRLAQGLALKLAPVVFLVLLAVALTLGTDGLLVATGAAARPWTANWAVIQGTWLRFSLLAAGLFFAFGWLMARYVNINKFSLEGMYRDRLIRAYIGASNPAHNASRFTGFAANDDLRLGELDPGLRPLHVLNQTLNLVSDERLAWQQRKAESFTMSPLHCGSAGDGLGYRPAREYGGEGGVTLGTAVAISGAAASPNMGYYSSPLVGFIMTLFNVRLGAWLGNPGRAGEKTWRKAGPASATSALLREALGLTTDKSQYVYLSDGGHFEDLGLYEMVRRRCRSIVVLDGGQDPSFAYADLGNALRKIRIDFRIPIKFGQESEAALRARRQRWAVARIEYSAVDPGAADGELIYLKPMLLGTEPPDVTAYAKAHPSFPHQSTAEQWFDESQTESYRMLGICTVSEMCAGWAGGTLAELAQYLAGAGAPRARAAESK